MMAVPPPVKYTKSRGRECFFGRGARENKTKEGREQSPSHGFCGCIREAGGESVSSLTLARCDHTTSRALSLRNLVSGYECGRVFPAGIGPGSPSRDAANWLPSRSDLSVETRRQYGWLRMVFSGVRLFRAPIWWPSGGWRHARGREHCRGEPGGSLSGGYAPDSAKAEGSSIVDEPGEG